MAKKIKRKYKNGIAIYNPAEVVSAEATGGLGYRFEHKMQALFASLMLCDGELSFAPRKKMAKLQFQVRRKGYLIDDCLIVLIDNVGVQSRAFLQIKLELSFIRTCEAFTDTIQAAWIDYKNEKFSKSLDKLVIVTGPLKKSDSRTLDWLTSYFRGVPVDTAKEEMCNVAWVSKDRRRVFDLICDTVRVQDESAEDGDIIEFIQHLYLFCPDTVYEDGAVRSFAVSLIKKHFPASNASVVLSALESRIAEKDSLGCEVTQAKLIAELNLIDHMQGNEGKGQRYIAPIPYLTFDAKRSGLRGDYYALLALAGMWSETAPNDRSIICEMLRIVPERLGDIVQSLSQVEPPLVEVESGVARVKHRRKVWRKYSRYLSKGDAEQFFNIAARLLAQEDESLKEEPEKRYLLSQDACGFEASKLLREGIAKGVALFSSDLDCAKQLTYDHRTWLPVSLIRSVLGGKGWRIWASLDDLLPYLAEVAPGEYIHQVDLFVKKEGALSNLYGQEYRGIFGRAYILGLVNSLGVLAWFPEYIARALQILGIMAAKDPDGQWHPRPIDIFQQVLHPLAPHTWATPSTRVQVLSGLIKKLDNKVAWDVIRSILPSTFYSFAEEANGPIYRNGKRSLKPAKSSDKSTCEWEFEQYGCIAVSLCGNNVERICQVLGPALDLWSDGALNKLLLHLKSIIKRLKLEGKYSIWHSMQEKLHFLQEEDMHKAKINWDHPRLKEYLAIERLLAPKDIRYKARSLFNWRSMRNDANAIHKIDAVKKIYKKWGINGILDFASKVDDTSKVGSILGKIGDASIDKEICPSQLKLNGSGSYYSIMAYIAERFASVGWSWVKNIVTSDWNKDQIAALFVSLPFTKEVWLHLKEYLGRDVAIYWQHIAQPYVSTESELEYVVDELLSAKCAYKAVNLLAHNILLDNNADARVCLKALKVLINTKQSDGPGSREVDNIPFVIKIIQDDTAISDSDKEAIEWCFIDLVDWYGSRGLKPLALWTKLASDPEFFCEAVRIAFLPEKNAASIKKRLAEKPMSAVEERRAANVWKLLHYWHMVPGMQTNGAFDESKFKYWVKRAFASARKMDRLTMAKATLANVLIYAPEDKDGFWLPRKVADLLEKKGNETMLTHYGNAWFNSRGVHHVDRSGEADEKLAKKYDDMAEAAEAEGYVNLAVEMRRLSQSIRSDFKRMQEEDRARDKYYTAKREERELPNDTTGDSPME